MNQPLRCATILSILVAMALVPAAVALSGTTVWTINSGMSAVTLAIPQQQGTFELPTDPPLPITLDFRAANQGTSAFPWSVGNTSSLTGTINTSTNYNTMVDFLGGTQNIDGLTSGSFRPLPAGGDGSALADFGGLIQSRDPEAAPEDSWTDTLDAAVRDVLYDLDSGVVAVSGGNFAATSLSVGVLSASLDYRGVGILGSYVTPGTAVIPATSAPNTALTGSITVNGPIATLTIPINVPITITASGVTLNATLTGTIVATNTLPIPGDANMDGFVDIFDINLVSSNWGGPPPDGDVNYDGAIDIFDINLISANWMPATAATPVPEPAAFTLVACGALTAVVFVGRSRRRGA